MKIIDTHMHLVQYIAGTGAGGELRYCGNGDAIYANGEIIHNMIPSCFGGEHVTPDQVIEIMDQHHVEKAVLLQGNYYGFQNLYTVQAAAKYPNRFAAAVSYDPFSQKKEEIRKHLFEDLGVKIVKFEVSTGSGLMSNHPIMPLDGDIMEEACCYAEQQGNVFVIDIGKCQSASWQIDALRNLILRHPNMKFVICHLLAANMNQRQQLSDALYKLRMDNVWFDLASVPHNCRPDQYPYLNAVSYVNLAKNIVGSNKLMFGTDLPSALKEDSYQHYIDYIMMNSSFTLDQKEQIFYRNADEVFFSF